MNRRDIKASKTELGIAASGTVRVAGTVRRDADPIADKLNDLDGKSDSLGRLAEHIKSLGSSRDVHLERDYNNLKARIEELRGEISDGIEGESNSEKKSALSKTYNKLSARFLNEDEAKRTIDDHSNKIKGIREEGNRKLGEIDLISRKGQIESLEKTRDKVAEELRQGEESRNSLADMGKRKQELEKSRGDAQGKASSLNENLAKENGFFTRLLRGVFGYRSAEFKAATSAIRTNTDQISELHGKISSLEEQISRASEAVPAEDPGKKAQLGSIEKEIGTYQAMLAEDEQERARIKAEIDARVDPLQASKGRLQDALSEVPPNMEAIKAELGRLEEEFKATQNRT